MTENTEMRTKAILKSLNFTNLSQPSIVVTGNKNAEFNI
jgi:hypothetical protein